MIDLVRLARFAGARVILDRATGIDREARLIHLAGRPPLPYDLAAIDVGITSDLPSLPGLGGARGSGQAAGPLCRGLGGLRCPPPAHPRVVILGAGVGGVELALASAHRLRGIGAQVTLLDQAEAFLPTLAPSARRVLERRLTEAGVGLAAWGAGGFGRSGLGGAGGGEQVRSDFTLTATGARPHGWLAETGLRAKDGFLVTDATLRTSDPLIFASGDCAGIEGDPRPKAGVFAVRAAKVAACEPAGGADGQALEGVQAAGGLPEADLSGRTGGGGGEMGAGLGRVLASGG